MDVFAKLQFDVSGFLCGFGLLCLVHRHSQQKLSTSLINDVCLYCRTTVLGKTADNVYIDGTG
jgi:hypothetical protein